MDFFNILEQSSKEGVLGFQKQNHLFTKKEIFGDNEFELEVVHVCSLIDQIDNTYYYHVNDATRPLLANITITNTITKEKQHFNAKVHVCGDLEAYMFQYSEENEDYISIKEDEKAILDETYENKIEFYYFSYKQLQKRYPNKTLKELEEFIYLEKNPWMEVWIFDENNEFFCHLENWYFCCLQEVLDLELNVFYETIIEAKKR